MAAECFICEKHCNKRLFSVCSKYYISKKPITYFCKINLSAKLCFFFIYIFFKSVMAIFKKYQEYTFKKILKIDDSSISLIT